MGMTPPDGGVPISVLLAHRDWVRRVARALVRDEASADDLEQEVWLRALRTPPRHGRSLRAWLGTVLRHAARDARRAAGIRARREADAPRPGPAPSPRDVVADAESFRRVVNAVMDLEEPYRTAILLRFFDDLAPTVIAARQGIPVDTVKTRLRRALQLLRERMDRDHGGDRRAWVVALLPAATGADRAPPSAGGAPMAATAAVAALWGGVLVAQKAIAGVALLALAAAWWLLGGGRESGGGGGAPLPRPGDSGSPAARNADAGGGGEARVPPPPAAPSTIEPAAPSGPSVTGSVRATGGGTVADARVELLTGRDAQEAVAEARCDADGEFRIAVPGGARGPHWLRASAPGRAAILREAAAGDRVRVELPAGGSLRGRVLTVEDGSPVPGAVVRLGGDHASENLSARAVTDERGEYRFDGVLPWRVVLQAFPPRRGCASASADVRAGEETVCDVYVPRGVRLDGRVVDDGGPVAGVRVIPWRGWSEFGGETVSDGDGRFAVEGLDREDVRLLLVPPGRPPAQVPCPVPPGADRVEREFRLGAPWTVTGRVVGPDGPVAGARVRAPAHGSLGSVEGGPDDPSTTSTDAAGAFVLRGAHALRGGRVLASAEGLGAVASPDLEVAPGETRAIGDLILRRPDPVALRLVDGDGVPARGVVVTGSPALAPTTVLTGEDGLARFEGPPGPAWFQAGGGGYLGKRIGPVEIVAGGLAEPVDVALERGAEVAGRVTDEAGRALPAVPVAAFGDGNAGGGWGMTDGEGRYVVRGVPPASPLTVRVTHPSYETAIRTGVAPGARDADLVLRPTAAPARGRVFLPDGVTPCRTFTLWLHLVEDLEGNPRDVVARRLEVSQGDGRFSVGGDDIFAGTFEAEATSGDMASARSARFRVGSGETPPEVRLVLAPGGRMEGEVRTAGGDPVAGARVTLPAREGLGAFHRPVLATTDAAGAFQFAPLGAGRHRVAFTREGFLPGRVEVEVEPGAVARPILVLRLGGHLRVRVRSGAGTPVAGARVLIHDAAGREIPLAWDRLSSRLPPRREPGNPFEQVDTSGVVDAQTLTAGDGTVLREFLPPGPVRVRVGVGGGAPVSVDAVVRDEEIVEVDVEAGR